MADEKEIVLEKEEDVIVTLEGEEVAEEQEEDKSLKTSDGEEEEDGDDDEEGGEDDATEAKRASRREARKRKREHAKHEKEALQRELAMVKRQQADLIRRLENADNRGMRQDISQVDAALTSAAHTARQAEAEIAAAVAAGDGTRVVEAQRKWYQAAEAGKQLQAIKQRMTAQPEQPKSIDPVLQANYQAWMARNTWYDTTGRDVDSKIALAIDAALTEEGYDPRRMDYWDELDNRLRPRLPHRYTASDQPQERTKPRPPTGGSAKVSSLKPNQIRLSPERVAAMKEAGAWDDPVAKAKMIKRYAEHDRIHKGER